MKQIKLEELSNEELLQETKKMKSAAMLNAVLVGIMIGIIIFSILKNTIGFFTLIPLYFAYKLINGSKDSIDNKALKEILKERNLK